MKTGTESQSPPGRWTASYPAPDGAPAALALQAEPNQKQPACASDESCRVLFDGVLYNRGELAALLEVGPALNDAALVLAAYNRWGEGALGKLSGIFALLLCERRGDSLLCARDPLGIYPLFYSDTGRGLVFSTSVDALLRHPSVPRQINRAALAGYLLHWWSDTEETVYERMRRVPPGHAMRVDRSGRRLWRYWDPAPPGEPVNWVREDELEHFDALLVQAVRRCLGFGPAAIYLSGGLDSVSVAAVAAEQSGLMGLPAPHALSLIFPDPECNEEDLQRRVAARLGLEQTTLTFEEGTGPDGWLISALEAAAQYPMPPLNPWGPVYFRLGQRAPAGRSVILTGTGGDEWLGVSPLLAADLIRAGDFKGLCRLWGALQRSYRMSRLAFSANLLWSFGLRPLVRDAVVRAPGGRALQSLVHSLRRRTSERLPDWIAPDPALRAELERRRRESAEPSRSGSHYLRELRLALDHLLPCWEMEENFDAGQRLGRRILHPFLDPDLVAFLYRTPPRFLNRGGRSKGLVRDALARRFPQLGFGRQKKVLATTFYRTSLLKEGAAALGRTSGTTALAKMGILDENRMDLLLQDIFANARMTKAFMIWDLLGKEAWLQALA